MGLKQVTEPVTEPVSLEEAKAHLRVDGADDDALLGRLITAARRAAEQLTGRAFITQTWDLYLDVAPSFALKLPRPPLQSAIVTTYGDDDQAVVFDASSYLVDTVCDPGRLVPKTNWPTGLRVANGFQVRFVAGYGAAADVPDDIKQGILLLVGHLYENREAVVVGTISGELPLGVKELLQPYRLLRV